MHADTTETDRLLKISRDLQHEYRRKHRKHPGWSGALDRCFACPKYKEPQPRKQYARASRGRPDWQKRLGKV